MAADPIQQRFASRWRHLADRHVRGLAWLLDSADLLDAADPRWGGRIATLGAHCADDAADWLAALDQDPRELHEWLKLGPFSRLGRYAERLLAYYFHVQGKLAAQGLQVRDAKETVGEFDFLLKDGDALLHWEFAIKFYLLEQSGAGQTADYFVGPNLADTLGAKMDKILVRQLALAQHPAAAAALSAPVSKAQALVKGWLFYPLGEMPRTGLGIDAAHCHGFWCTLGQLDVQDVAPLLPLNRLDWIAPARVTEAPRAAEVKAQLAERFEADSMPVLVAQLEEMDGLLLESRRGFIVPDDWESRAGARSRPPLF